jgi:hypothetical protein
LNRPDVIAARREAKAWYAAATPVAQACEAGVWLWVGDASQGVLAVGTTPADARDVAFQELLTLWTDEALDEAHAVGRGAAISFCGIVIEAAAVELRGDPDRFGWMLRNLVPPWMVVRLFERIEDRRRAA